MKPVEIISVVFMRRRKGEFPAAMHVNDVFDAGGGLGEGEIAIVNDRGLTEWVQVFDGLRGEDGGALMQGEGVGDLELFTEPGKALRLGDLEVVDC